MVSDPQQLLVTVHPSLSLVTMRKSYFDADGIEKRELPGDLSDSARRAIEATEVEEAMNGRDEWKMKGMFLVSSENCNTEVHIN